MLTADQLDALTDPILELYQQFEDSIIRDIARRLGNLDFATPTAAWQMERLAQSGMVYENALKELSSLTGKTEEELRTMFSRAGVRAMRFDDKIYRAAGLDPIPLNLSPQMAQVLAAGLWKTGGVMRNLTMTTALSAQQSFVEAADLAYMQVAHGAMDYNSAIRGAVKKVAADGIGIINYATGRREQLDVAMRSTVLTGVNQTVGQIQIARIDEMGVDLVQTSAHIGARPAHQIWQGQVFSRSGKRGKYPDFVESTGYGTGPGLCGYNCRHSFYPFIEGISENAYKEAELTDYASQTVTYNNQVMSVYDATQKQRAIERKIRYWKRQQEALKEAGQTVDLETAKVKAWQAQMRDFIRQTGLQRQSERERIFSTGKNITTGNKVTVSSAPAPVAPPPPRYQYKEAATIAEASAYGRDVLGLEFCDYKGADIRVANEWNKGLTDNLNRFPALKKNMTGTGTTQARYSAEYEHYYKKAMTEKNPIYDAFGYSDKQRIDASARYARARSTRTPANCYAYSISPKSGNMSGVFVNGKIKYSEAVESLGRDVRAGFHPVGTGTIRSNLDHEIGHQIDDLLHLRNDPEFSSYLSTLTKSQIKTDLSVYAAKNTAELIAEAWSEYTCNPNPRTIAQKIGDMIMRKYKILEGNQ